MPAHLLKWSRVLLAAGFLVFGILVAGIGEAGVDWKWIVLTCGLFLAVFAAQWVPHRGVQVYTLWAGAFLVLQTLASPWLLGSSRDYRTLPLGMDLELSWNDPAFRDGPEPQHLTTDAKGFRVNPRIDYEAKSEYRIFAIGGSTTEQYALGDRATWSHLLQEWLKRELGRPVSVVNTGVSGLRAINHEATLKEILRYQPDMALFLLGVNDWNKQIREHFGSRHYEEPGLLFRDSLLGRALDGLFEAAKRQFADPGEPAVLDASYYTVQQDSLERADRRAYFPDAVAPDYLETLGEIAEICRAAEIECVFLTQPSGYAEPVDPDLKPLFWMTPPNESWAVTLESLVHVAALYNHALAEFCRDHDLPLIDLAGAIAPTRANFWDDVHFTLEGSRAIADYVGPRLAPLIGPR